MDLAGRRSGLFKGASVQGRWLVAYVRVCMCVYLIALHSDHASTCAAERGGANPSSCAVLRCLVCMQARDRTR